MDRWVASAWPASAQPIVRRGRRRTVWPRETIPAGGSWRPSLPVSLPPSSLCLCSSPLLAGLVVHAYVARRQNRQYVLVNGVFVGSVLRGVPTERARQPGPGPYAAAATQPSTAEVPASSVATTPSIASLSRSARPRAARACHVRHPQNIPAIPTAGTARLAGFIPLIRM